MSVNVVTIQWLKEQRKITDRCLKFLDDKKFSQVTDEEVHDRDRLLGELFTYERIIKYMKGLDEREFQLQKKRGTL